MTTNKNWLSNRCQGNRTWEAVIQGQ